MCNVASAVATILAYSEWRPTRWKVTTSTGRNYGLFTSHDKAALFAEGVRMSLADEANESDYVSIRYMRDAAYDTWLGDNIGCSAGRPARIEVRDQFGIKRRLSVKAVLSIARDLDAQGLTRVVLGLRAAAEQLHPDDLAAWREHEDEYPLRDLHGSDL